DGLEHGQFMIWVETECGLSIRTAQRAMQVAELGIKNVNLTYLPVRSLLLLAARSTPKEIRDEIIQRIDVGERPTAAQLDDEVEQARAAIEAGPNSVQREAGEAQPDRKSVRVGKG